MPPLSYGLKSHKVGVLCRAFYLATLQKPPCNVVDEPSWFHQFSPIYSHLKLISSKSSKDYIHLVLVYANLSWSDDEELFAGSEILMMVLIMIVLLSVTLLIYMGPMYVDRPVIVKSLLAVCKSSPRLEKLATSLRSIWHACMHKIVNLVKGSFWIQMAPCTQVQMAGHDKRNIIKQFLQDRLLPTSVHFLGHSYVSRASAEIG